MLRLKPKGPECQPQVFFQWLWVLSLPPEHRLKTVSGTTSLANNHTLSTLIRTCHVICKDQCNMKMQESLSAITKSFKMVGVEHETSSSLFCPGHTPLRSALPLVPVTQMPRYTEQMYLCVALLSVSNKKEGLLGLELALTPQRAACPMATYSLGRLTQHPSAFPICRFAISWPTLPPPLYMRTPGSLAKVQGRETQIHEHSPRARQGTYLLRAQALLAGASELHSP